MGNDRNEREQHKRGLQELKPYWESQTTEEAKDGGAWALGPGGTGQGKEKPELHRGDKKQGRKEWNLNLGEVGSDRGRLVG